MAQEGSLFDIGRYGAAVEAFNRDDLGPLSEMLAEDCVFATDLYSVGNSRVEIIANMKQARSTGWTRHVVLSIAAAGDFAVILFRNEFGNGTSTTGGGVIRVNDDGEISEIRTVEQPAPQP
jgi:hypothetical protein